jgi:hypothetical protein
MSSYEFMLAQNRQLILENCAILAAIAICTAAVAIFAHSASGLWSMLLIMFSNTSLLKPAQPCNCEEEEDDDEDEEKQAA